jgi:hypothetical protein
MLDRQNWEGAKTSASQPLEWPRTGVYDKNGDAVSSSTIPQAITDATIEQALVFVKDAEAATSADGGSVKSLTTEETTVVFANVAKAKQFNSVVMQLIQQFLASGGVGVPVAYGTDETSQFEDDDRYDMDDGLA